MLGSLVRVTSLRQKKSAVNKAIKVMLDTRRFWYEVQCALLVQWGTPYCRRYINLGIGAKNNETI